MFEFERIALGRACLRGRARAGLVLALLLALVLALVASGCASGPAQALRGARHYSQGTRALERGDGAIAIAELEEAARLVPRASEVQNHLGLAYWSEGRMAAAERAFGQALELDCDNRAAQHNLEALRAARGLEAEDSEAMQRARDRTPVANAGQGRPEHGG